MIIKNSVYSVWKGPQNDVTGSVLVGGQRVLNRDRKGVDRSHVIIVIIYIPKEIHTQTHIRRFCFIFENNFLFYYTD